MARSNLVHYEDVLILFILLVRTKEQPDIFYDCYCYNRYTYSQLEPPRARTNKAIYLSVSLGSATIN